jgi:DNA-binding MarR family transcriptional regulator
VQHDEGVRSRDPVEEASRHWADRYPDAQGFSSLVSLIRAYSVAVRSIEVVLRPLGLNLSRYEVLLLLSFTRAGRLPTMRLRDLLMVHGSSVTYLVDKLEEAGLVERQADAGDGRVLLVCVTDAGRVLVDDASRALAAAGFGAFAALDAARATQLIEILAHVRASGNEGFGANGVA